MVVSLLRLVLDLPGCGSLKEKRRILSSLKERLRNKYQVAVAEVGRNEAWQTCEIGSAVISNSRAHGEAVLQNVIEFAASAYPVTVRSVDVFSEHYGPSAIDVG